MRYLIGFLGVIAILILIIVLVVRGGGNSANGPGAVDLADYITSSSQVRMTTDGPVSASETHQSVRISVNQNEATIDIFKGYEGDVTASKTYPMNPNSYAVFMLSLKRAGFTLGNADPKFKDERGYCALGSRNIYELYDDGRQTQRYWGMACSKDGTFKGNGPLVRQLFELQIPAYGELTSNLNLGSSGTSL